MLGDAYLWVDLQDADGLECLAWAVYDGVFMTGNKPALSGHYDWDRVVAGTLIHLIFQGQTDKEHCGPVTIVSFNAKQAVELAQQQGLPQYREREEGLHHLSGACMEVSNCAIEGDSTALGHVLPLYGRSSGHGAGLCSRFQWGESFS